MHVIVPTVAYDPAAQTGFSLGRSDGEEVGICEGPGVGDDDGTGLGCRVGEFMHEDAPDADVRPSAHALHFEAPVSDV